jgi:hypothetical protein
VIDGSWDVSPAEGKWLTGPELAELADRLAMLTEEQLAGLRIEAFTGLRNRLKALVITGLPPSCPEPFRGVEAEVMPPDYLPAAYAEETMPALPAAPPSYYDLGR